MNIATDGPALPRATIRATPSGTTIVIDRGPRNRRGLTCRAPSVQPLTVIGSYRLFCELELSRRVPTVTERKRTATRVHGTCWSDRTPGDRSARGLRPTRASRPRPAAAARDSKDGE